MHIIIHSPLGAHSNMVYLSHVDKSLVLMDSEEFKGDTYQRVYQYIRRFAAGSDLNAFSFQGGTVEGSPEDCLKLLLKYGNEAVVTTYHNLRIISTPGPLPI